MGSFEISRTKSEKRNSSPVDLISSPCKMATFGSRWESPTPDLHRLHTPRDLSALLDDASDSHVEPQTVGIMERLQRVEGCLSDWKQRRGAAGPSFAGNLHDRQSGEAAHLRGRVQRLETE